MGGNDSPSADDVKKILSSVGVDCDKSLAQKVVDQLSGKNIQELIAAGKIQINRWHYYLELCSF